MRSNTNTDLKTQVLGSERKEAFDVYLDLKFLLKGGVGDNTFSFVF